MLRLRTIIRFFMEKGLAASALSLFKEKRIFFIIIDRLIISLNICLLLLSGNFFFKHEASATSFSNPEVRLVSGSADYNRDLKKSLLGNGALPVWRVREYEYYQEHTTMIFTETDQNSTQAQICDYMTDRWEDYQYGQVYDYSTKQSQCVFLGMLPGAVTPYKYCRNESTDLTLYAGMVTENYWDSYICDSNRDCKYFYSFCGLDLKERFGISRTISGNSTTTLQFNCQDTNAQGVLKVTTFVHMKNVNNAPQKTDVYLNGYLPTTPWMYTTYDWYRRVYEAWATMNWAIPIEVSCGSTISLTPSVTGFAEIKIYTIDFVAAPCDLKITNFAGSSTTIDPSAGESTTFSGNVTETTGKTVTWTVTITDSSGAQWRKFSGSGKNPSITWDGKDSFGKIVDNGLYAAALEARTSDGKCIKQATAKVTVKSSCKVSMTISSTSVWPQIPANQYSAGAGNTEAEITVTLENPAPSTGCTIELSVTPEENSGGHNHTAGTRPKGSVSPSTIAFAKGEQGPKTAKYKSSEVSGKEKIKGKLTQTGKIVGEETIYIAVTGLSSLGGGAYNLKCSIESCSDYKHVDFYNVQPWVALLFGTIADQYHEKFPNSEKLVVTDASLWWGGLYDYQNTWGPPHKTHRIGTDIDVRSWNIPDGNRDKFEEVVCENSGMPLLEFLDTDSEHYHLFFMSYKTTKKLCKGDIQI